MKTLFNKKIIIALLAVACFSTVKAQLAERNKLEPHKKLFIFSNPFSEKHIPGSDGRYTANAHWKRLNVPHKDSSFIMDIEVPDARAVWGAIGLYNIDRPLTIYYVHTADAGFTWKLDSLPLSEDYGISSLSPLDDHTCYAAVANVNTGGGGIYKTDNGGKTWRQLFPGKLFNSTSFPDFVHFFDAQHGVALGDGNGPGTPYLEIYTTNDAGISWERVPSENIPAPNGFPYSTNNGYTVAGNTIWFEGFDSNGGQFIYRSDDHGHHWQAFPLTVQYFSDFAFADTLHGLFTGFDDNGIPVISATNDGGVTWKNVKYSGIPMALTITAMSGTSTYVTTSGGFANTIAGSSYSNDEGKTWTLIDSGTTAMHNDVKFLNSSIGWSGENEASSSDPGGMYKWRLHFPFRCNSFAANKTNDNILLNWNVAIDFNNDYYSIERSADGVSFSEIGQVKSYNDPEQQYVFEDNNSPEGQQYYRLKQVNNDGDISYSNIIKIDFTSSQLKLYPNPVNDILKIEGLISNLNTKLSIIDIKGRVVQQVNTGGPTYNYNVQKLAAGSYYLKVETGKQVKTLKFVKE